jgi:hypothetical protein
MVKASVAPIFQRFPVSAGQAESVRGCDKFGDEHWHSKTGIDLAGLA